MGANKRPASSCGARPHKRPAGSHAEAALVPPQPNRWEELLPAVPPLGRKLRVALPCIGIDGCGTALRVLRVPHVANNVRDLESRYSQYLESHLDMDGSCKPRLGPSGDLLKHDLQDLERPVDVLIAGPPCPPWAGQGKKQGTADDRSWVYVQVLRFVVALIKCNDLLGVLLENVKGILQAVTPQLGSFMDKVVTVLEAEAPEFHWRVQVLQAADYRLAQQRTRVFLCGARKSVANSVPDALPPLGALNLRMFLLEKVPCVVKKTLTKHMQQNLKDAEKLGSNFNIVNIYLQTFGIRLRPVPVLPVLPAYKYTQIDICK